MLDEQSQLVDLGQIATKITDGTHHTPNYTNDGVIFLSAKNLREGGIDFSDHRWISLEEHTTLIRRCNPQPGDVMVSKSGSLGTACVVPEGAPTFSLFESVALIKLDRQVADADFVSQYLNSPHSRRHFGRITTGLAVQHLHLVDLRKAPIHLPPLPEQRRIAGILRTWDKAIDAASRLIDAKRRRLDAITFRLVFGGARLANFGDAAARQEARWFNVPAAWRVAKIGDLAKEVSRTNADGAVSEVLSCSKHDGFVRSLEYFKKQVFSADLSGYKIIARGDFGFPSNHVEEGSIGLQNIADIGMVSPIYCVFRFDAKKVDADYAFRVLKTSVFRHMFSVATSASVDRRGSLRWKEFRKLPFPVPPLAEQQAIAAAVDLAAQDLAASETHLDALKRQKRGLMQKLLTGDWRVPAEPAG